MPSVRRNARTWTVLADFVGFGVEHRVEYLGRLLRDEPVESGPDMCRSIRMMFSGMVPSPGFQSRFFVLANERTVRRTRGHAFHVRIENPKRARIRTLSVFIPELRYLQFNSASGINEIKSKTLHSPNHPQQEIHQSIHQLEGCNTARATLRSSD